MEQRPSETGAPDAAAEQNDGKIVFARESLQNDGSMSAPAEAPPTTVVVAVVVTDATAVARTVEAIGRQVYAAASVVVVGGDRLGRKAADDLGLDWVSNRSSLIATLDPTISYIWFIDSGAIPRPDALAALVDEGERVHAGIAGSKLLSLADRSRLLSVGVATDVFDTPYTGLDEGEIDAGQYDVVRDVAAVDSASMLIRRDLARGLGGLDPLLPPGAAAIDLCQRARVRGGRVVIVPSSEVAVSATDRSGWREDAGAIRAMLKVYSLVTLLWAVPLRFVVGLFSGIANLFLGRLTLVDWLRAWAWNLAHLPSTITGRWEARRHRAAGDAELFRYQARGSATLRAVGELTGERLRDRLPGEDQLSLIELGRELRQPAIVVGAVGLVFVLAATRRLWDGLPSVGFSLPLPESAADMLGSYAGGWNPAGMGSVEPLHPFFAVAGVVQRVLFDNPNLAAGGLFAAAFLSGVWGTTRLLRTWNIDAAPGLLAGLTLMAGPAAQAIGAGTGVETLLAVGVLPWAVRIPLSRFPVRWMGRIGKVAAAGWVSGLLGLLAPPLLVAPLVVLVVHALIAPRQLSGWRSVAVGALGAGLAVPLLFPWLGAVDLDQFLGEGTAFWEPGWILVVAFTAALVATVVAAPSRLAQIAGLGGVVTGLGAVAARSFDWGLGRDVHHAGLALVALGSAMVVGAAYETITQIELVSGWRRAVAGLGVLGAAAMTVTVVVVVLPGRGGLPGDTLEQAVSFTGVAFEDAAESRILLVGPAEALPGESRMLRGTSFRVISAPEPRLWEARLPEEGPADLALAADLDDLIDGEISRAGEQLATYGIRWVIFLGESPLDAVFAGQLDLVPLQGLRTITFVSEAEFPFRAVSDRGDVWAHDGIRYVGGGSGSVFVAESANSRWGTGWQQQAWGSRVEAAPIIEFEPIESRRNEALGAAGLFAALVIVSWIGRRRR